jgi:tetratricopeptide (TPR) repeat protein
LTREEDAHFIAVSEPAEDDSAATTEAGKVLARLKCSLAEAKVEAEKGEYLRALQLVSDVVALGSEPLPRPKSETMVRLDLQAPKENEAVSDAVVARHQLTVASALYERGKVLLKLSLWSSAAKDFSESIAWLPDEAYDTERLGLAVRWERAHLLGEQLKHAEALALTDELLAPPFGAAPRWMELTGKERAAALELRARCLVGLGQDDAALDQLTALKLIDGARPSARRMAAGIFKRRNDVHSALRELRAASILDPSDGELCAEVLGLYMAGVRLSACALTTFPFDSFNCTLAGMHALNPYPLPAQVDKTMAVTIALEYLDELIVEDPTSRALLERATLRVALARLLPRNEAESHYAGASADLDRVFALCDRK